MAMCSSFIEAGVSWLDRLLLPMAGDHLALNYAGTFHTPTESTSLMKDFHTLNCVSPRRTPRQRSSFLYLLQISGRKQERKKVI
jgi:hypothetical protein